MALRHAVLAVLLDRDYSGYQLAKVFDTGVANFWYALPQQLYAELAKLEQDGMVSARRVIQHDRPNKRVYTVTEAGLAELSRFTEAASKPPFVRDDLMVKVHAVDRTDAHAVIAQLEERAVMAQAKIDLFEDLLKRLRGKQSEEEFLREGTTIGPYLTCLRGRSFEMENLNWCRSTAHLLTARMEARQDA